jgi:hypothetical protein
MCSHPDPLADWRAVRVVGRVMVTCIHTWYLRRIVKQRATVNGTLYSGGLGFESGPEVHLSWCRLIELFLIRYEREKCLTTLHDRFSSHSFQL